jgi:hypothetical protein
MSVKDFISKHKGKIAAASGALAALLGVMHMAEKGRRSDNTRKLYESVASNPREYGYEYESPYVDVGLGRTGGRRKTGRRKTRRSNPLLKAVQAYRKKHGCSLKEAWAAVRQ